MRKKDLVDNSVPSGNGLAVTALLRLADLAGRDDYRQAAQRTLRACMGILEQAPGATGQLLLALEMTGQEPIRGTSCSPEWLASRRPGSRWCPPTPINRGCRAVTR